MIPRTRVAVVAAMALLTFSSKVQVVEASALLAFSSKVQMSAGQHLTIRSISDDGIVVFRSCTSPEEWARLTIILIIATLGASLAPTDILSIYREKRQQSDRLNDWVNRPPV
jgi:hypothetical protein